MPEPVPSLCAWFDPLPSCAIGRFTCPCCSVLHASPLPLRVVRFKVVRLEIHGSLGSNPVCLGRRILGVQDSIASRVVLSERSLAHTAWSAAPGLFCWNPALVGGFPVLAWPTGHARRSHSTRPICALSRLRSTRPRCGGWPGTRRRRRRRRLSLLVL